VRPWRIDLQTTPNNSKDYIAATQVHNLHVVHALRGGFKKCAPETTGKKIGDVPLEQRFGVTVQFAAQYAGVSKSSIYELLAVGDLAGRVIAGRHIVEVQGPRGLLRLCGQAPSTKRENKTARSESALP